MNVSDMWQIQLEVASTTMKTIGQDDGHVYWVSSGELEEQEYA